MTNLNELDMSVMTAIEWLTKYGSIDTLPEDFEAEMLISKAEDKKGETFEGLGRVVNWELYLWEKLIAKRKSVKGGTVKRYTAVGQWLHEFVLEVEHNAKEVLGFNKKTH